MKKFEKNDDDFDAPVWIKLIIILIFFYGLYEITGVILDWVNDGLCA